jgi:hypothetical protein
MSQEKTSLANCLFFRAALTHITFEQNLLDVTMDEGKIIIPAEDKQYRIYVLSKASLQHVTSRFFLSTFGLASCTALITHGETFEKKPIVGLMHSTFVSEGEVNEFIERTKSFSTSRKQIQKYFVLGGAPNREAYDYLVENDFICLNTDILKLKQFRHFYSTEVAVTKDEHSLIIKVAYRLSEFDYVLKEIKQESENQVLEQDSELQLKHRWLKCKSQLFIYHFPFKRHEQSFQIKRKKRKPPTAKLKDSHNRYLKRPRQ